LGKLGEGKGASLVQVDITYIWKKFTMKILMGHGNGVNKIF
jgi:hypothetical protein